ncbi:flagellar basal body rod protein FlgC [Pseudalkalibacillus salsuginis]|uniref:flagellar basal body rod protein FlgC n=1 Tax=Pseudalkalibacillus salsuginis TaxID=2910972 RepID=UPI001F44A6DE|nr:flagellar basal body rod protein FlgC [Pseudalkalibacillus salsuginis]MCF6410562.1 flagellar basal body rod protein FlgC [Pseudalkalibacillus salsuginis]
MGLFNSLNISGSALTAQRLRMDVASSNMANAETTRSQMVDGQWQPYRRKMVVLQPQGTEFKAMLAHAQTSDKFSGVRASAVVEDDQPFKLAYQPDHPDADAQGYVRLPNVDPLKEMVDLMSATRSYEANVTVMNAAKGMYMKALEIGR